MLSTSKTYLGSYQTSMMKLFFKNSKGLLVVDCFRKKLHHRFLRYWFKSHLFLCEVETEVEVETNEEWPYVKRISHLTYFSLVVCWSFHLDLVKPFYFLKWNLYFSIFLPVLTSLMYLLILINSLNIFRN